MGVEMTDMEVPNSEVAPRPDPGRQYVGWAGRVLQVHDAGGGSRATTTEAGSGVDVARTGLGDADSDRASLAVEAEFGTALAGSESRADVAPKDELADILDGRAKAMIGKEIRRAMRMSKARGGDPGRMNAFKF